MKRFVYALLATVLSTLPVLAVSPALGADLVVVAGGSGGTGQETIKQLVAAGYEVRATTTNVERAQERFPDWDIEWVKMDVRKIDEIRAALTGADYLISTIGGSCRDPGGPNSPRYVDYEGVMMMAGVSRTLSLKQMILVSAANAGVADQPLNRFCDNIQMWKWLGEDYLRDSGFPYTIVRPGGLVDEAGGEQGIDVRAAKVGNRGASIPRADVAAVLVEAIGNDDAMGKTFEIFGAPDGEAGAWKGDLKGVPADAAESRAIPQRGAE